MVGCIYIQFFVSVIWFMYVNFLDFNLQKCGGNIEVE